MNRSREDDTLEYVKLFRVLKFTNKIIFILILCICFNIIASPYIPEITYAINKSSTIMSTHTNEKGKVEIDLNVNNELLESKLNTIIIPSINLEAEVKELNTIDELHDGTWRRPLTSTPDAGGNTVIIAHRYTRRSDMNGPNTFYHLPKVKVGETVYVYYEGVNYTYEVYNVEVVSADRVDIEDATADNILTLYTCTPIWSAKDRHVVQARLVNQSAIVAK